jgi:hypothetical protein
VFDFTLWIWIRRIYKDDFLGGEVLDLDIFFEFQFIRLHIPVHASFVPLLSSFFLCVFLGVLWALTFLCSYVHENLAISSQGSDRCWALLFEDLEVPTNRVLHAWKTSRPIQKEEEERDTHDGSSEEARRRKTK